MLLITEVGDHGSIVNGLDDDMNNDDLKGKEWDLVITSQKKWFDVNIKEIWDYRDLVLMFVKRDFVTVYKQTVLGPLWYIIQPLVTTVIFTIIFGKIAKVSTDDVPPFLFYMSGNVMWGYFSTCLISTSNTFVANAAVFGKVYFPRLTAPVAIVILNLVQFCLQFVMFVGFYLYFYFSGMPLCLNMWAFSLPFLVLQMALLSFGLGILISSMTTKYKDLRFALTFLVQLWMYATPIVYPLSQVPEKYRLLYCLNPMASIVEGFRFSFLSVGVLQPSYVFLSWVVSLLLLLSGIVLFGRVEKNFMDTV